MNHIHFEHKNTKIQHFKEGYKINIFLKIRVPKFTSLLSHGRSRGHCTQPMANNRPITASIIHPYVILKMVAADQSKFRGNRKLIFIKRHKARSSWCGYYVCLIKRREWWWLRMWYSKFKIRRINLKNFTHTLQSHVFGCSLYFWLDSYQNWTTEFEFWIYRVCLKSIEKNFFQNFYCR